MNKFDTECYDYDIIDIYFFFQVRDTRVQNILNELKVYGE